MKMNVLIGFELFMEGEMENRTVGGFGDGPAEGHASYLSGAILAEHLRVYLPGADFEAADLEAHEPPEVEKTDNTDVLCSDCCTGITNPPCDSIPPKCLLTAPPTCQPTKPPACPPEQKYGATHASWFSRP
jgi:hypothetical protein